MTQYLNKELVRVAQPIYLTEQQKLNIQILSYNQAVAGMIYDPETIYKLWPTDPSEEWRAGKRPSITAISQYKATDHYREGMLERGIEVHELNELTQEQLACISIMTDVTSNLSPTARLKKLGIPYAKYRGWLRQKAFNEQISAITKTALTDAIPIAETKLVEGVYRGDLKFIKYLNEITGRYNPAQQQVVDTQALMNAIVDAAQEVFGQADPELFKEFIEVVRLRAATVKGVLQ